jgi:hypothetical protein
MNHILLRWSREGWEFHACYKHRAPLERKSKELRVSEFYLTITFTDEKRDEIQLSWQPTAC